MSKQQGAHNLGYWLDRFQRQEPVNDETYPSSMSWNLLALRPFILYYAFGAEALQDLEQVTKWILSHGWTVGELWNMLMQYSSQMLKGETRKGFFNWLLPSFATHSTAMLDLHGTIKGSGQA